ncbi:MAG: sigma-70 family RNA polymerase sigma factor, partial [Desulfobacterales bacterium]|nr:sigma-70 family RNA polymerase sigma factor [Desulfobacterales bacterium]
DFLSRSNRRKFREMERAAMRLEQQLGRQPDDEDVAEELGVSLEELFKIKTLSSISFISFEDIGYNSREEKDKLLSCLVNDSSAGLGDALTMTRLKEIQEAVAAAIEALPEKEKLVISLYYWDELTMKEIGKVMGITESRVSQIHSQSVLHLRRKLIKKGLIDVN